MSVNTWGLGKHGQLCNGKMENQLIPFNVTKTNSGRKLGPVMDISCGAHFTAVVCSDGSLYTSGCGKYGRLGHGPEEKDCTALTSVAHVSRVKTVSCGFWHAACVNDDGQVFVWGYSRATGADPSEAQTAGRKPLNVNVPKILSFRPELRISGVSCGYNYTFAWTVDGQTFSWGRGQHGVLGHGSEKDVSSPEQVEHLRDMKIMRVGAGHSHCGMVSSDGDLYMTGSGSDNALGFGVSHQQNALVPTKVAGIGCVQDVSCSKGEHHHHTLALTVDGAVMAWGDGYKGKLGLGDQESKESPTEIDPAHFHKERVVRVCAGGIHSAASTETGSVFTWGCGSDGRLGHPEAIGHRYLFRSDHPRKVEALKSDRASPALVSCSYYHTAAVVL